ncbi:MAG: MotA/TolQ/ExbB proton channel family protein [Chitinivibrionia bacterium]|jgi:biopolymer transport protein TolQ|nr:MotA/TolQ/ExbB proton channel family protein [Chitinivibrionia bacterium]
MNSPIVEMLVKSGPVGLTVCWILLIASLISWVVIINRIIFLNAASGAIKNFKKELERIDSLRDFGKIPQSLRDSYAGHLVGYYISEFNRIAGDLHKKSAKNENYSFFFEHQVTIAQEKVHTETSKAARKLNWGLHILAIMSSAAPFVGLFGTVWGIMDSFFEIGKMESAALSVVAPGIAIALITTVAGLLVAIPSLVFYNLFVKKAEKIEDDLDDCADLGFTKFKEELLSLVGN